MNRFGRYLQNTQSSDHCKCPKILSMSSHKHPLTERQSLKTNGGNAEESCWSVRLRGERKYYECPQNLQTPQRLCEVKQGHKKPRHPPYPRGCFYTSFGSTHAETSVSVITALLEAASSFPEQAKRKKERKIRRLPQRPMWWCFFCTVETTSNRRLTNVHRSRVAGPRLRGQFIKIFLSIQT